MVLGRAGLRSSIFRREMPLVLEAIRYGEKQLFTVNPDLDDAPIIIHFQSSKDKFNKVEEWGFLRDFRLK
jgi:hypothetical protein